MQNLHASVRWIYFLQGCELLRCNKDSYKTYNTLETYTVHLCFGGNMHMPKQFVGKMHIRVDLDLFFDCIFDGLHFHRIFGSKKGFQLKWNSPKIIDKFPKSNQKFIKRHFSNKSHWFCSLLNRFLNEKYGKLACSSSQNRHWQRGRGIEILHTFVG